MSGGWRSVHNLKEVAGLDVTGERTKEMQDSMIASVREELHELSQPVTAMMCLLELAKMQGDDKSMREAIDSALRECTRVVGSVRRVRLVLEEARRERLA